MRDYNDMEYDELRQLHTDISELLEDKKEEALEKIRSQVENLGLNLSDLCGKKNGVKLYRDPNNPENTYKGKGPKPQWLKDKEANGEEMEAFRVH